MSQTCWDCSLHLSFLYHTWLIHGFSAELLASISGCHLPVLKGFSGAPMILCPMTSLFAPCFLPAHPLQLFFLPAFDSLSLSLLFWRRQWHPTLVLLPEKFYGRRSLVGCSPWGREESDMTERLHFHFSLSCIGEGNGTPLQCSCLENPRDRGAWLAAVYGVAWSWTRLKRLSSSSSSSSSCLLSLLTFSHVTYSLPSDVRSAHSQTFLSTQFPLVFNYEALSYFPLNI